MTDARLTRRALLAGFPAAAVVLTGCSHQAQEKPKRSATPGKEANPTYSSAPKPGSALTWDYFMPATAPGPGSYTQDKPSLWAIYAGAGATTYAADPSVKGAFPAAALTPGANGPAFTAALGDVISDCETSAARLAPTIAGQHFADGQVLDVASTLVNRYPKSVNMAAKSVSGAVYVYAVSTDADHIISYTAKV